MTLRSSALSFAVPGILACLMVLGSAAFLIIADSIKEEILIASAAAVGIATLFWIVGVVQTSKEKQWNIFGFLMAVASLFGLATTGAIAVYWFVNLRPFM